MFSKSPWIFHTSKISSGMTRIFHNFFGSFFESFTGSLQDLPWDISQDLSQDLPKISPRISPRNSPRTFSKISSRIPHNSQYFKLRVLHIWFKACNLKTIFTLTKSAFLCRKLTFVVAWYKIVAKKLLLHVAHTEKKWKVTAVAYHDIRSLMIFFV